MGEFTKQVVVCLAQDLEETATAIANKYRSGRVSAILRFGTWTSGLPARKMSDNGEGYVLDGDNSRLVIVAHCDPGSKGINSRPELTGKRLAEFVSALLDRKIGRITLHMCFGGGNQGTGVGPFDSIACEFASYAGQLTSEVTARTDVVSGTVSQGGGTLGSGFKRTVGGRAGSERRLEDKVVFTVDPSSSLKNSVRPQAEYRKKG